MKNLMMVAMSLLAISGIDIPDYRQRSTEVPCR
jgi:hypothetical protein